MKLICDFQDNTLPLEEFKERSTARAFVLDKHGRIALLHLFGKVNDNTVDTYVTPGGGINLGEEPENAIQREIGEELGLQCELVAEVGTVIDYYNDVKRRTISYYFIVKATEKCQSNLTPIEHQIIKNVEWLTLAEAFQLLQNYQPDPRGMILHRRDLCALVEAESKLREATRKLKKFTSD